MTKLIITIDLDSKIRPTDSELAEFDYESELHYWMDFAYTDTPEVLDGAIWEIVE